MWIQCSADRRRGRNKHTHTHTHTHRLSAYLHIMGPVPRANVRGIEMCPAKQEVGLHADSHLLPADYGCHYSLVNLPAPANLQHHQHATPLTGPTQSPPLQHSSRPVGRLAISHVASSRPMVRLALSHALLPPPLSYLPSRPTQVHKRYCRCC